MTPSPPAAEEVRVMLCDDSATARSILARLLESEAGIRVVHRAADGRAAVAAVAAVKPDVVLLDWNMPVMDGITFLRAARAEFGGEHPRIVLCTTEAELSRIVQALEAGAQEYVMKPFDAGILRDKFTQAGLLEEAP